MTTAENQGSILVVDDNPNNLKVLIAMLSGKGYKVRPAIDGKTALIAARESKPDMILLDITMPGMDGYEVSEIIKADEHLSDVPIIFVSAMNDVDSKLQAFRAGGVDFVTKPFHLEEVSARVNAHMLLHQQRQQIEVLREQDRQNLEALRKSEARYRDLFENAHDLIQSVDGNGRFLYVNDRWSQVLGYAREALPDLSFLDVIHPESRDRCIEIFERLRAEGGVLENLTVTFQAQDGHPVYAEGNVTSQRGGDGSFHTRGIFRDVTEKLRAERRAFDLAIERERIRILSEIMTHDFRTPLAIISTQLHLMRRLQDVQQLQKRTDMIEEQVRHLTLIIDQFGQLATLANESELEMQPLRLNDIFNRLPSNLDHLMSSRSINLILDRQADLPMIKGNPELLQIVYYNLLHNAIAFSEPGHEILVRTDVLDDAQVYFEVLDKGCGISEEHIPHIFDPWYKSNEARTPDGTGAGMGLAIVRRIVDLHNARIEVESVVGEGSVFRVIFVV